MTFLYPHETPQMDHPMIVCGTSQFRTPPYLSTDAVLGSLPFLAISASYVSRCSTSGLVMPCGLSRIHASPNAWGSDRTLRPNERRGARKSPDKWHRKRSLMTKNSASQRSGIQTASNCSSGHRSCGHTLKVALVITCYNML